MSLEIAESVPPRNSRGTNESTSPSLLHHSFFPLRRVDEVAQESLELQKLVTSTSSSFLSVLVTWNLEQRDVPPALLNLSTTTAPNWRGSLQPLPEGRLFLRRFWLKDGHRQDPHSQRCAGIL